MKIGNILQYGIFDSKKQAPNATMTAKRVVSCFEFDYILSCDKGTISFIDSSSHKLYPNMLIIRKPNQICNSLLHYKCYCLHLELDKDSIFYDELSALPNFFPLIHGNVYRSIFESLIQHIITYGKNCEDHYIAAKLLELFYRLSKDSPHNKTIRKSSFQKENSSIQQAVSYIKKNFDQHISLRTLGELTGYTPNHFQRVFTKIMNISPQKYLENIRISQAKHLLATSDMPIVEIAYACGFSSQSYFSLLFKRSTELTPNEFRKSTIINYTV